MSANDTEGEFCPNPQAGENYDLTAELALIDEAQNMEIAKITTRYWYRNERVWRPATDDDYSHFLGCVPPLEMKPDGFLCGEPYSHSATNFSPVCLAFKRIGEDVFAMLMTHHEYVGEVAFPREDEPGTAKPGLFDNAAVVHIYTRTQAIADGVLVDVTETATEAGFKVPCVVTIALHNAINDIPTELEGVQDYQGRLWDVLMMAHFSAAKPDAKDSNTVSITVAMPTGEGTKTHELLAQIHPGDGGEPVLTIGYPSDF